MAKRVIVMGKGELACRVLRWVHGLDGYELPFTVPVVPEPDWSASLTEQANELGVPVRTWRDVRESFDGADLLVSIFWNKIFKDEFLGRFDRAVNIHNSALPSFRGVNPVNWSLKNGRPYHGVTVHRILPGVDDGPIYGQARFPVDPERDEVRDVYAQCLEFGFRLFQAALPTLWEREPYEQSDNETTPPSYYSSKRRGELGDRSSWTRESSGS